jgi:hypothetical protein
MTACPTNGRSRSFIGQKSRSAPGLSDVINARDERLCLLRGRLGAGNVVSSGSPWRAARIMFSADWTISAKR